jgi:hypothetical protein
MLNLPQRVPNIELILGLFRRQLQKLTCALPAARSQNPYPEARCTLPSFENLLQFASPIEHAA